MSLHEGREGGQSGKCAIGGARRLSRPKLCTEQKREEDAIDSSDIGRAGIFLFGRELFADSAFVA